MFNNHIIYIYIYCVINYSDNIFIPLLYYLSYDVMYKDMISYKGIIYTEYSQRLIIYMLL